MNKQILIIGSGMGGLAAGIYGQLAGFSTRILEAHTVPGGQCTSWNRSGFVFDGCIHYFGGTGGARNPYDRFWSEVGAFPCEMCETREGISALDSDGTWFHDLFDLEKLENHLKTLSPEDTRRIDAYLKGIRLFMENNPLLDLSFGSVPEKLAAIPSLLRRLPYFLTSLERFAKGFRHPLLRKAFPYLHYSAPGVPLFLQLSKHSDAASGSRAWPRGGSRTIARNMAARYESLGGEILYGRRVTRILVDGDRAAGVELENGDVITGDYVISNADGRKTIRDLLGNRYTNRKIRKACGPRNESRIPWAVAVYLGVNRDLSDFPSSLLLFLDEPMDLCGCMRDHICLQSYGHDPSMAPSGKGVIKAEFFSPAGYFDKLYGDRAAYRAEKERIAETIIGLLNARFPGLAEDVEVRDVTTLNSWERYMGGTDGFQNYPAKPFSLMDLISSGPGKYTLPGLRNFYMTGQWVTSAGALYLNAVSGRDVIRIIKRNRNRRDVK